MSIYPVVLTGGAGSRLWPMSREFYPKPLLPVLGDQTLLQDTVARLDALPGIADPLVVCNEEHRFLVGDQLHRMGKKASTIMLEPVGRDTAPALTLAALQLQAMNPDALMVVMPADHLIPDTATFAETMASSVQLARDGALVTFGIDAVRPETGYGYIKLGESIEGSAGFKVDRFVEKPDLATAQQLIETADHYWNSGIFVMQASRWLEELGKYRADILEACQAALVGKDVDSHGFVSVDSTAFNACPADSIDFAVMEKTDTAAVVPMSTAWSDVGSWSSLWSVLDKDEDGNAAKGDVFQHGCSNSLLMSQNRCIAAVGLEDVVVVETADAVLVVDKNKCEDVKKIVGSLKAAQRDEYQFHRRVHRPWGDYEGIDSGDRYQVKRITVRPGGKLSLQMHHHRAEHWIVVAGTALVTKGEEEFLLRENESVYIPLGVTHRLENPGSQPLELIEVQSGSYLGEDDIVRFEDVYDRVDSNIEAIA